MVRMFAHGGIERGENARAEAVISLALSGQLDEAVLLTRGKDAPRNKSTFPNALVRAARGRWGALGREVVRNWRSVADSHDFEQILFNLAVALWSVDELGSAREAMILTVDRGDESARLMLAEAELFLGNAVAGEAHLVKIVARQEDDWKRASGILGGFYFRERDRIDAEVVQLLSNAGDSDPRFPVDLAEVMVALGNIDTAVAILRGESATGNDQAPLLLGNILSDVLGDSAGAERAYLRGIKLGDAFSAYNLAATLDGEGRRSESRKWLKYAASHGDERAKARLASDGLSPKMRKNRIP